MRARHKSAKRTMITSPYVCHFLHQSARRSRTQCRYTLARNGDITPHRNG